jgi:hypothetical protein
MKKFNHISSNEIIQDIKDTESEIIDYNDELEILMRNRLLNKVRIYMIEGHLIQHKELTSKLNKILDFRNNENPDK